MEPDPTPLFDLHRAIVEHATEAIIAADRQGAIRLWNPGAERLFGFTEAEALGASLDVIIPPKLQPAHAAGYGRAMQTGSLRMAGRVLTTRAQNKQGERVYVDMSFGLLTDASGQVAGAFAIARDVTARYLEEQARRAGATSGSA